MRTTACTSPLLLLLLLLLPAPALLLPAPARALSPAQSAELLRTIDDRQANSGDWKARFYMEQKRKGEGDLVYDGVLFRRAAGRKLMILFLAPRSERGKGYLRLKRNLWHYDPRIGKWERRTERERIAGTDSNRQDFDDSRLAQDYDARHTGDAKLGRYTAHRLTLTARKGRDVAYPRVQLWVDRASKNVLKRQDFAASGKLLRTLYFPKWVKVHSPSKRGEVWYARQIRIFDELVKANRTTIVIRQVDLAPLPTNLFTKAWLESKSR